MPAPAVKFIREHASHNPILPIGDNVLLCDGLEFAMERDMLEEITRLHEEGYNFNQIARCVKRYAPEVLIALIHQALEGKIRRPIGYLEG